MRSGLFGWDLPPGVSMSDIDPGGYDEHPLIHCSRCGGFLPFEPDRQGGGEDLGQCDGKRMVVTETYHEDRDAGILAIIGEEFIGKSYEVEFDPECGRVDEHEPHTFVQWAWGINYRTCSRCGYENEEVDA